MKLIDLISKCLRAAVGSLLPSPSPSQSHWTDDSVWFGEAQTLADDTARQYANPDHYALNFEDLRSEVVTRLTKCKKLCDFYSAQRKNEFFRYAKTVANNRARTLVIQHMATRKRAGDFRTDGKPVYVSMDDPDHTVPQEVHNRHGKAGAAQPAVTFTCGYDIGAISEPWGGPQPQRRSEV